MLSYSKSLKKLAFLFSTCACLLLTNTILFAQTGTLTIKLDSTQLQNLNNIFGSHSYTDTNIPPYTNIHATCTNTGLPASWRLFFSTGSTVTINATVTSGNDSSDTYTIPLTFSVTGKEYYLDSTFAGATGILPSTKGSNVTALTFSKQKPPYFKQGDEHGTPSYWTNFYIKISALTLNTQFPIIPSSNACSNNTYDIVLPTEGSIKFYSDENPFALQNVTGWSPCTINEDNTVTCNYTYIPPS